VAVRRLITVPGYLALWLAWVSTSPIWVAAAAVVDLARGRGTVALRSGGLVLVYLTCEVLGLAASAGIWLARAVGFVGDERWLDLHFRLQAWWGTTIFHAIVRLFGLELSVQGEEEVSQGPFLLLPRHVSSGDSLLASALVAGPYGLRLRYVLKQELLWDPCLDVVGNRLPNAFIERGSPDEARQIARIAEIASGLGPNDGVLIYPEGSRATDLKRDQVIEKFKQAGNAPMSEYARALRFVLPPRPGGALAALEAAPDADVVFCEHVGFEGASSLTTVWQGDLLGGVLHVRFRRVPRAQVPVERADQIDWLLREWRQVDEWVAKHRLERSQ